MATSRSDSASKATTKKAPAKKAAAAKKVPPRASNGNGNGASGTKKAATKKATASTATKAVKAPARPRRDKPLAAGERLVADLTDPTVEMALDDLANQADDQPSNAPATPAGAGAGADVARSAVLAEQVGDRADAGIGAQLLQGLG